MDKNRVIWQEGLFLRPQHFQQQERFLLNWTEERCQVVRPYNWGFTELTIDTESLTLGKLIVLSCQGVFPDGTPFSVPNNTPPPEPLDVPSDMKNCRVYLGLPLHRQGVLDVEDNKGRNTLARYSMGETTIRDVHTPGLDEPAELTTGSLQLSILTEKDNTRAYSLLPLAHILERGSDQRVRLEPTFIPTVMHCGAEQRLSGFLREIKGLLKSRGDAMAAQMAAPSAGGNAEVTNFMQLQLLNRYELLFNHLSEVSALHPDDFYRVILMLAGEMATFTRPERRPPAMSGYRHENLDYSFHPVMEEIRRAFLAEVDRKARQLEIRNYKDGYWAARISDKTLLHSAIFVLAAKADIASERLRQTFPKQTTIGTVEKITELVHNQVPGIGLYPMQVMIPEITLHAGFTYFEIDSHHKDWQLLDNSAGLCVHIGTQTFVGLELELWAIRS